jgi:erythromycin esterase-like protein
MADSTGTNTLADSLGRCTGEYGSRNYDVSFCGFDPVRHGYFADVVGMWIQGHLDPKTRCVILAYGTTFYAHLFEEPRRTDNAATEPDGVPEEARTAVELLQARELAPLTREDLRGLAKALENAQEELGGGRFYGPTMARLRTALGV